MTAPYVVTGYMAQDYTEDDEEVITRTRKYNGGVVTKARVGGERIEDRPFDRIGLPVTKDESNKSEVF